MLNFDGQIYKTILFAFSRVNNSFYLLVEIAAIIFLYAINHFYVNIFVCQLQFFVQLYST